MAGAIMTGNISLDLVKIPVQKFFGKAYENWDTKYDKIFEIIQTDERFARDVLLRGMSVAKVKHENDAPVQDDMSQVWNVVYEAVTYGIYASVSEEALEDTHDIKPLTDVAAMLKKACLLEREVLAHNVLNLGFSGSQLGGDGVQLFSTTHPTFSGVNLANRPAVDADASVAIAEQAYIDIRSMIDERNLPAYAIPGTMIVSKENELTWHTILKSVLLPGSADNDANPLRDLDIIPDVVVTPYLSSTNAFFIKTSYADNGLKMFNRKEITLDMDDVFLNGAVQTKAIMRLIFGWTDPRGMYGVNGA